MSLGGSAVVCLTPVMSLGGSVLLKLLRLLGFSWGAATWLGRDESRRQCASEVIRVFLGVLRPG